MFRSKSCSFTLCKGIMGRCGLKSHIRVNYQITIVSIDINKEWEIYLAHIPIWKKGFWDYLLTVKFLTI